MTEQDFFDLNKRRERVIARYTSMRHGQMITVDVWLESAEEAGVCLYRWATDESAGPLSEYMLEAIGGGKRFAQSKNSAMN